KNGPCIGEVFRYWAVILWNCYSSRVLEQYHPRQRRAYYRARGVLLLAQSRAFLGLFGPSMTSKPAQSRRSAFERCQVWLQWAPKCGDKPLFSKGRELPILVAMGRQPSADRRPARTSKPSSPGVSNTIPSAATTAPPRSEPRCRP